MTLFSRKANKFFINLVEQQIDIREQKEIVRPDVINLLLAARKDVQKQEEFLNVETGFATVQETQFERRKYFDK